MRGHGRRKKEAGPAKASEAPPNESKSAANGIPMREKTMKSQQAEGRTMITVRVRVAAGDGVEDARRAVEDVLELLNRHFRPRGVEFVGAAEGEDDWTIALYWKDFGEIEKEEFEAVYERFKRVQKPVIHVFFKEPDEGIGEALKAFKDGFAERYGHFYCHFETVDAVRFQLAAQSLSMLPGRETGGILKVEGARVVLGRETVASLENLSFAKLNSRRRTLHRQVAQEEREIRELEKESKAAPCDEDLQDALREARVRRNHLREELRQHDEFLFGLALRFSRESTGEMDERVRNARELFEQGKAREANQLLDLPEMEAQAQRNLELFLANREACEKDIQAFTTKAELVLVDDSLAMVERVVAACQAYDNAIRIAREIQMDEAMLATILLNYGELLKKQNRFQPAIERYSEALLILRKLADRNRDANEVEVAKVLRGLAGLHSDTQCLSEAESEYSEALKIFRKLAFRNLTAHDLDVADTLNSLGVLYQKQNRLEEAEAKHAEALILLQKVVIVNPDENDESLADALNNMAILHRVMNQWDKATEEFASALSLYRKMAKKDSDTSFFGVATTLSNLAVLHWKRSRFEEALQSEEEALSLCRQLAVENPARYEPYVAGMLHNLAIFHYARNCQKEAEREYVEALRIYRQLTRTDSAVYEPDLAMVLNNLAVLHRGMNCYDKAETEYTEALTLRRKLMFVNPDAYEPYVAETLLNIAVLHKQTQRLEEAEEEDREALEIQRRLAVARPDVHEPGVAATLYNMALLFEKSGKNEEALAAARESLETYGRCAERNPQRYGGDLEDAKALVARLEQNA